MILKVNKDICEIKQNEVWNVGDYNVHTVQVELSEEFDGLVKKVRYFVEDNSYDMLITDNVAQVPYEATVMEGTIKIGVYGYDADTDILVQSTSPVNKYIASGTYTGEADNTQPLTPTDKEQMETAIQKNADDIIELQNNKQNVLISGENIKTINNESILGNGNIEIDVGSIDYNDLENKPTINNIELKGNKSLNDLGIQPAGNYATMNDLTEESRATLNEIETTYYNKTQTNNLLNNKQNTLISGQNIKTINNESILGEGNITIQGGGSSDYEDLENLPKINSVELKGNKSLNDLGIQPIGNYALESEIPDVSNFITNSVNNLLNYYLKSETYTKQEVNNLIGQIATLQFQVVATLPQTGDSKYIYLVPSSNPKTQNVKDEYIWVNNAWEQIGSTQVDLTGYATENWVNTQISGFLTQSQIQALISTSLSDYALESEIPTKTSDLTNDSGFITGYTETDPTVPSHVKNITQANITSWNNKQNAISDLSTIRSGASAGATAVQPSDLATVATSGSYNDLSNKPSEVTESTVSSWGFTKNTGTYSKPSGGIPKTDLSSAVQTSLGKADSALQAHQDISGKLDTSKVKNTNSTTAGDVYDVRYINTMLGDVESLLGGI